MAREIELREIPFGKREIVIDFMHVEDARYGNRLNALLVLSDVGTSEDIELLEVLEDLEMGGTLRHPKEASNMFGHELIIHILTNSEFEQPHDIKDEARRKVVRSLFFRIEHIGYYRLLERPYGYVRNNLNRFKADGRINSMTWSELFGMMPT